MLQKAFPSKWTRLLKWQKSSMPMTDTPFSVDSPEQSTGLLLWQTTITWQRLIKQALEPFAISHTQFVILAVLLWWQMQGKTTYQKEIIQLSKLDKMTVSKALKTLCTRQLVTRKENPDDTRSKSVHLTPSGVKLTKQLVPIVESIDHHFFSKLKQKEQTNLTSCLQNLMHDT